MALGGSLHQHVQELPGRFDHRSDKTKPLRERYGLAHPVRLTPGGALQTLFDGAERIEVNSLHGQGIDRLADRLTVEAVAEDGTIEAVSVQGAKGFALAVQWHPEWAGAGEPLVAPPVRGLRRGRARPCRRQDSARPRRPLPSDPDRRRGRRASSRRKQSRPNR